MTDNLEDRPVGPLSLDDFITWARSRLPVFTRAPGVGLEMLSVVALLAVIGWMATGIYGQDDRQGGRLSLRPVRNGRIGESNLTGDPSQGDAPEFHNDGAPLQEPHDEKSPEYEQWNAEQKAEDQQPDAALRDGRQRHDVVQTHEQISGDDSGDSGPRRRIHASRRFANGGVFRQRSCGFID